MFTLVFTRLVETYYVSLIIYYSLRFTMNLAFLTLILMLINLNIYTYLDLLVSI